jgi:hypothetical protein
LRIVSRITAVAGAAVLAAAFTAATAGASVAPSVTTFTASTKVTNHPDSNAQDGTNWALDNFTRTAAIHRVSQEPVRDCVATGTTGTGTCWFYTGTLADDGTFTTIKDAKAPRTGTEDQALTGSFKGGSTTIEFFSSWKTPNPADVPKTVDGDVTGRETSTNWVEQFFGPGAVFNDSAGDNAPDLGAWSWAYTASFGFDAACLHDAYQWVDAANNSGGSLNTDGNVLTPSAADCT